MRWFTDRSTQNLADLHTSTSYVQYFDGRGQIVHRENSTWTYTSWGTFYRALLADFGTEHYHYGKYACGFSQDQDRVTVRFVDDTTALADLAVFADGITSSARERFDPDAKPTYSGYIGWRGTVPQSRLSASTRTALQDAITYNVIPHSHIMMYPIPGEDGIDAQHRLMNYVWYRNAPSGPDLTEMLTGKNGFVGAVSVHPGQVQEPYISEMRQAAADLLAPAAAEVVLATENPYLQVISDVRSNRMARGRVALSATPHAPRGRTPPQAPPRPPPTAGHWPQHCGTPADTLCPPSPNGNPRSCSSATIYSDASWTWANAPNSAIPGYPTTPACGSGSTGPAANGHQT